MKARAEGGRAGTQTVIGVLRKKARGEKKKPRGDISLDLITVYRGGGEKRGGNIEKVIAAGLEAGAPPTLFYLTSSKTNQKTCPDPLGGRKFKGRSKGQATTGFSHGFKRAVSAGGYKLPPGGHPLTSRVRKSGGKNEAGIPF